MNNKEQEVLRFMAMVKVSDKHQVSRFMVKRTNWTEGASAVNNTYKILITLVELGKLEKLDGYFRIPGCKAEWKNIHTQLTTKYLNDLIIQYPNSIIFREPAVEEVGLRPDAICLLINGDQGRCVIMEVMNSETKEYLQMKINAWQQWQGATEYLSKLFGYNIKHFEIVSVGGDL